MRRLVTKAIESVKRLAVRERERLPTFGSVADVVTCGTRELEEDRNTAEYKTESAPEVLDDEIFHESVVEASAKNAIDMFDQGEVALVESVFLRLVPAE